VQWRKAQLNAIIAMVKENRAEVLLYLRVDQVADQSQSKHTKHDL